MEMCRIKYYTGLMASVGGSKYYKWPVPGLIAKILAWHVFKVAVFEVNQQKYMIK